MNYPDNRKNYIQNSLTASNTGNLRSNQNHYLRLFIIFIGLTGLNGVLIFVGRNRNAFAVISLATMYLAVFKPKIFTYFLITWTSSRLIFSLQPTAEVYGVQVYEKGSLLLNFLRFAHPDNYVMDHLHKAMFLGILIYILPRLKNLNLKDRLVFYPLLFIIISIISTIVNFDFQKNVAIYFYKFLFPIILYYYLKINRFSKTNKSFLFMYMLFVCFEMQILFTLVQNIPDIMKGRFFFGDNAIGTFMFPRYPESAGLLAWALFYYLMAYYNKNKAHDLLRAFIAFYGILSGAVILFTLVLISIIIIYYLYGRYIKVLSRRRTIYLIITLVCVLIIPIGYIFSNLDSYYGRGGFVTKLVNLRYKKIEDIGKFYSFINLFNMLSDEDKYIFGSGPGTFLTRAGLDSPLAKKYSTVNRFGLMATSSHNLDNTFVGLVGEIGLIGWFCYISFYFVLFKRTKYLSRGSDENMRPIYNFLTLSLFFIIVYSFLYPSLEVFETLLPLIVFISLVEYNGSSLFRVGS